MSTRLTTIESHDSLDRRLCIATYCGPTGPGDRKMYQMSIEGKWITCNGSDIDKLIVALVKSRSDQLNVEVTAMLAAQLNVEVTAMLADAIIDMDNIRFCSGMGPRSDSRKAAWFALLKIAEAKASRLADQTRANA